MKKLILLLRKVFSFIKIDYSFFLLLFLFYLLDDITFYLIYLVFLISHEVFHLIIAKKLGYLPKKLKLTAFGASLEGYDDFLPSDEIKIILAGPIFNLVVVIVCYLSFWFYPESYSYLNTILLVNLSILFFNMIPIFPLDCGRLVLCLISRKKGRIRAVSDIKIISLVLIVFMFLISMISFFFYFNFSLGFVSFNLCLLLFDSCSGTSFKREILLRKKIKRLVKGVPQKIVFVKESYPKQLLLKFLDGEHYFIFVFVNEKFEEIDRIDEFSLLHELGFI